MHKEAFYAITTSENNLSICEKSRRDLVIACKARK